MPVKRAAAPDGGWGWMIVVGACIGHMLNGAIARSMGVFYLLLKQRFDCNATMAAWLTALPLVLWTGLAPITTALCTRFSCRSVTISGGILMGIGLFLTAFVEHISLCFITFGLIAGTGLCTVYVPGYIIVGQYFDKRKAIAMALSTIGSGLGAFIFPPVVHAMYVYYGHRGCFLILSAIMMNGCVGGALFRPYAVHMKYRRTAKRRSIAMLEDDVKNGNVDRDYKLIKPDGVTNDTAAIYRPNGKKFADGNMVLAHNLTNSKAAAQAQSRTVGDGATAVRHNGYKMVASDDAKAASALVPAGDPAAAENGIVAPADEPPPRKPLLDLSLLKIPAFLIICQLGITANAVLAITVSFLPALAVDRGMTHKEGAFLLSMLGIGDVIGRIPFGIIFDMPGVKNHRNVLYGCFMVVHGAVILSMPLALSYSVLVFLSVMRGLTSGVFMAQRATILADLIGLDNVPSAFGIQLLAMTVGALAARTAGGVLKDYLGQFDGIFYGTGILLIISASVFVAFGVWHRKKTTIAQNTLTIINVTNDPASRGGATSC